MIRKICVPIRYFCRPVVFTRLQVARNLLSIEAVSDAMLLRRLPVTCKIHRQTIGGGRVVLRVSGRLAGKNVDMLRTLLEQESNVLTLDLKDVRLVDGDAVKLLAIHESNGVGIDNCPLYIREWIRREREAT